MLKTASAGGFTAVRLPDAVFKQTQDLLVALTTAHQDLGIFVMDRSYTEGWTDREQDVPTYVKRMWRDICVAEHRPCIMAAIGGQRGQRLVTVTVPKRQTTKPIIAWIGLVGQECGRYDWYNVVRRDRGSQAAYTQHRTIVDFFIPEAHIETLWEKGFLRMCRTEWRDILKVGGG